MPKHGKRFVDARQKAPAEACDDIAQAAAAVKEMATAKFDETVDVAVKLGVDPRHADQMVRGAVALPHGTGKAVRVVVFAKGDKAKEAVDAGADEVGADDLAKKVEGGWLDFDVAVATPDMMGAVGKLGRVLGPRGLMPNPKSGTVTFEIGQAVKEIKAGKIEYRTDRHGIVHAPVGKASFSAEQIADNVQALIEALVRARPSAAKGQYLRVVSLSSTMGPAVRINPTKLA